MTDAVRPAGRGRGDTGLGLPELLVTMAVFGVLLLALGSVLVSLLGVSRTATVKTATTADARIAMEAMTRSLRVAILPSGEASAVTVSEPNRVQFFASLDRAAGQNSERATQVTYAYAAPCVTETQVLATPNPDPDPATVAARPFVWTGPGTTRCLIRTSAPPVFTYYTDGSITRADGTVVAPVTPTTATERDLVVSVQIALEVRDPERGDVNGVLARDRVTMTNLTGTG